ncbi:4'-phosphopantetheinyl transferase family protein [Kutzneria sp. CA-103260]|uniref:4'-phosphopantetheinyl transferase family protein n=1 Tax=Kutzneria sp. CA-103260 TaxID=2802641 RepID=UPI001BA7EEFF|nr:4'-phosphopantetheinyl transferase superfamily protein [Kutzneria sp. CA-103260]QUQ68519.1 4'-phosphopantetheinyl transferase superfamily protein [Kutzneria sp. CA-103260]
MIEELLPEKVAFAEAFDDHSAVELFPEEEKVIVRAVDKRRREFSTVRYCARQAMKALGLPESPILPGERGAPQWPDGVVGSMTHCAGYRAAALAWDRDIVTIGIDAEPDEPLPEGVHEAIALPSELSVHGRLLFSAKESVYKAWFPLARKFLDFSEAELSFGDGTFSARILVPGPVRGFEGRWLIKDGFVVTAIVVTVA